MIALLARLARTAFRRRRVVLASWLLLVGVIVGLYAAALFGLAMDVEVFAVSRIRDAFVIRLTFVPAVLALLGRRSWWLPTWLGRIVPKDGIDAAGGTTGARRAPGSLPA